MSNLAPKDNIDPNVSLPPAVRAAAARAEDIQRRSLGQTEPPAEQAQEMEQEAPADADVGESAPAPTSGAEASFAKPNEAIDWEHRYNSMKGRYDREVQARQQLSNQFYDLQRRLAELETSRQSADMQVQRLLTPEEEQEYGPEFLGVVAKKAKEELSPELARLENELAQLRGQVNGVNATVAMTAREKMEQHLDSVVPNWRELNTNPDFIAWLDLPDVFSGGIRKQLLHAAYYKSDAPRVAAFFKGFISDEAATNPAIAGAGREVTYAGNRAQPSKVPLEAFAAPGRAKTTAAPAPAEKPIFARAEITKFYSAVQRGEYAGRDAEKNRIESEIHSAAREGRIR